MHCPLSANPPNFQSSLCIKGKKFHIKMLSNPTPIIVIKLVLECVKMLFMSVRVRVYEWDRNRQMLRVRVKERDEIKKQETRILLSTKRQWNQQQQQYQRE